MVTIAPSNAIDDASKHEVFTFRYGGAFKNVVKEIIGRNTLGGRLISIRTAMGTEVNRTPKVTMP
jgi:hypothetical protein